MVILKTLTQLRQLRPRADALVSIISTHCTVSY